MSSPAGDLSRVATGMAASARDIAAYAPAGTSPRAAQVHHLLDDLAGVIAHHAETVRRIDDEIDLAMRRRARPQDIAALHSRRARETARLRAEIDHATTRLLPGGDRLHPTTILRRLTAPHLVGDGLSYFGRSPVDRAGRVARLTHRLLTPATRSRTPIRAALFAPTTLAARTGRLARLRRHLQSPAAPDTGDR